jgi:hypothetical protein
MSTLLAADMEALMKYQTVQEITAVAQVLPAGPDAARALKRARLERLATVLDNYEGMVKLFSGIEFISHEQRLLLRDDRSPLAVVYHDTWLREQGLGGDRIGDAMTFFDLSWKEAHHLFCDCHYRAGVTPQIIAGQVRELAWRTSVRDIWRKFWTALGAACRQPR